MKGEAERQTCDEKKTTSGTTHAATDYPGFRSATWNYSTRKRFRRSGGAWVVEEGREGGARCSLRRQNWLIFLSEKYRIQ